MGGQIRMGLRDCAIEERTLLEEKYTAILPPQVPCRVPPTVGNQAYPNLLQTRNWMNSLHIAFTVPP
jgi:hypothetical protein